MMAKFVLLVFFTTHNTFGGAASVPFATQDACETALERLTAWTDPDEGRGIAYMGCFDTGAE